MADEHLSEAKETHLSELQKMKIADLKKKLRSLGLPTTGSKIELIERLQEASSSDKDVTLTSEAEGMHSLTSESEGTLWLNDDLQDDLYSTKIDEDSLHDNEQFPTYSTPKTDNEKLLDHVETDSSINSNPITKPLKENIVAKTSGEGTAVQKRIQLNRAHHVTSAAFKSVPVSPVKMTNIIINDKNETHLHKPVAVKPSAIKIMTNEERLAMRAKRFNVACADTNTRTEKVAGSAKSLTFSNSSGESDLNTLKKRAQRFGQNVSSVMKQIEEKERLLKRKLKFGACLGISATSTLDEQEKKRRRADRFGIS